MKKIVARVILFLLVWGWFSLFFVNSFGWWAILGGLILLAITLGGLALLIWLAITAIGEIK